MFIFPYSFFTFYTIWQCRMKTRFMAHLIVALTCIILFATRSHAQYQNQSHETHFDTVKGPGLPDTDCLLCHDASHTVYPNVCDTCHSPFGAYNGVDDPVIGRQAGFSEEIYGQIQSDISFLCAVRCDAQ